jgi:RNA 2',3'-cyclic 3'-phosphodiesterase
VARLFSALVPPRAALDDLAACLGGIPAELPGLRFIPAGRWHVTLGFFGDDDQDRRARWLRRRLTGRREVRLRLAGGGTFPNVLWVGVEPAGERNAESLRRLAQAAGAGRRGFTAHVTVARWRDRDTLRTEAARQLDGYAGPWFTAGEVLLMRSDHGEGGPRYTVLQRLPLEPAVPG